MCVLSRRHGSGVDAVDIGFRPVRFVEQKQVVTVGPPKSRGTCFGKATVSLDDAPGKPKPYGSYPLSTPTGRVTTITTTDAILQQMPGAATLTIAMGSTVQRFSVRAAAAVVKALGTCQDHLVRRWGLDHATLHAECSHAQLSDSEPGKWFGSDHYQTRAIKLGAQGRTVAVLVVDATGKATSCKVVESAGNPDLDGATCRIAMARAAFVPSRDATSRPLRSAYVLPVRWTRPLG